MLSRFIRPMLAAMIFTTLPHVSTARTIQSPGPDIHADYAGRNSTAIATLQVRFSRLRHGVNLSHWFAQSSDNDYSKAHLDSHTTAADLALIEKLGFDHVRFTVE